MMIFLYLSVGTQSKSTKKSKDESAILTKKLIGKAKPSPPAIIAIEIVDPNEEKKNSKRTIESSLGYGYHSPPKYQVYKYSQHDIPPYRGAPNHFNEGIKSHQYDFHKSVSYKVQNQNQKYYQPGTTLYSTVNSQGEVGGLSSHVPQQSYSNEPHVPVIILRVYPSQLNDPSAVLHANLPQNHPLASTINSIDIQGLLTKYVQNLLLEQQQYQYQPNYQYQQYQQPQYHYPVSQPDDDLLTHENYPRETHTRVIFRTDKNKLGVNPSHTETKTIQIAVPEGSYSSVQVETPDMQYSYGNEESGNGQNYYYQQGGQAVQNYYYEPSQYQQVAPSGYQQVEQQYVQPEQNLQNEASYNNYNHNHQKRSKKVNFIRSRIQEAATNDVIKLDPIKA